MSLILLALLITSTPELPEEEKTALIEALTVPAPPPWPDGLPDAIDTDKGVLLPPALASHIHDRLLALEMYPVRCQGRIEAALQYGEAVANAISDACAADCVASTAMATMDSSSWAWWEVVLVAAGAAVFGGALGFGVAHAL